MLARIAGSVLLLAGATSSLAAQVRPDSAARADSLAAAARDSASLAAVIADPRPPRRLDTDRPPLSPRGAFFLSALLPGAAQARLDRSGAGAFFATIELGALLMVRRSQRDVREAERFPLDSVPSTYAIDPTTGAVTPGTRVELGFSNDLLRSRQLAVEDWLAVVAFNHLIAGADAFVSAQLWDVPRRVGVVPTARGRYALVASFPFGGPRRQRAR